MPTNMYDLEMYIADIYDQVETHQDDVMLLQKLLPQMPQRILEPFCGTGRIALPLAEAGHHLVAVDLAQGMLDWFQRKLARQSHLSGSVELIQQDVLTEPWPSDFDVIILGGNCFYELATAEEQESCIQRAYASLRDGGYVYVDNNHMEGDLAQSWQETGVVRKSLCGTAHDGAQVETTRKTIDYDVSKRLARFERKAIVTKPSGQTLTHQYEQQKHPVSAEEVKFWLYKNGFSIEQKYGNWNRKPYNDDSPRAIFWARKTNFNG